MKILFSFCNTTEPSDFYQKAGLSQLCILDTQEGQIYFLKIPEKIKDKGVMGLAQNKNYFYTITQGSKPKILEIDKKTLETTRFKIVAKVLDPHAIFLKGNQILIASTGTNSVEIFDLKKFEYKGTAWQHPRTDRELDQVHLNSIFFYKNDLWASCFGKKSSKKWSSAKNGYLINTQTNTKKYKVFHPHSAMTYENDFYFCESTFGKLRKNNKIIKRFKKSYVRGLAADDRYIAVGVSSSRKKSKSTGEVNNPADAGRFLSKTGIIVLDKSGKKYSYYDLSNFEKEIFDLLIVDSNICQLPIQLSGMSKTSAQQAIKENLFVSQIKQREETLRQQLKKTNDLLKEKEEEAIRLREVLKKRKWKPFKKIGALRAIRKNN